MTVLENKRIDLNRIFEALCAVVQLPKTLHEEAAGHYDFVSRWLNAEGSILYAGRPVIYPYGSLALGTEVKPLKRDEFDLDELCLISRAAGVPVDPRSLFDAVVRRLQEHADLKQRMEIDPPAIGLLYANQFRLEVVPGRPALNQMYPTAVEIVDYSANDWIPSDPKGYTKWFEGRGIVFTGGESQRIAASVEPAPEQTPTYDRRPLVRTVQLFKRRRDRYYNGKESLPASIVLTTLAAKFYMGEVSCYEALQHILAAIKIDRMRNHGITRVWSEVHPFDELTASWTELEQRQFGAFVDRFLADFNRLENARDMIETANVLRDMFGDDVTDSAVRAYTERYKTARDTGAVRFDPKAPIVITTGSAASASATSRQQKDHTFFGG